MSAKDWTTLYQWLWFARDVWRPGFRESKRGRFGGSCACDADIAAEFGQDARVLDASCGFGLKTIVLVEMGVNVTGSDGCEFAVQKAGELARLAGRERFRVHVHKIDDIACLLRLVDDFGLNVTVEHTMDVHDPHIYQELRKRGIPVIYGPLDSFAYKTELKHATWRNVRHLLESKVEFGLMTDHPVIPQRNLLLELRFFIRLGLTRQQALEVITRKNAELLGINRLLAPKQANVSAA